MHQYDQILASCCVLDETEPRANDAFAATFGGQSGNGDRIDVDLPSS